MLEDLWTSLSGDVARQRAGAALIILLGLLVGRLVSRLAERFFIRRGSAQAALITRRVTFYSILWLASLMAEPPI